MLSVKSFIFTATVATKPEVTLGEYKGIKATQTLVVPIDDPIELWDVTIKNESDKERRISAFSTKIKCTFLTICHIDEDKKMWYNEVTKEKEDGPMKH